MLLLCVATDVYCAEPELHIKPQTCIRGEDSYCKTTLEAVYTDDSNVAICFRIPQLQFEDCRAEQNIHEVQVSVETRDSVNVEVLDANTSVLLRQAKMNVAVFKPEATRKRRRFSWSFE